MRYIEKLDPSNEYEVLHVGQRIRAMEKDFSPCKEALLKAELIVFCYPVYTFLVPAQLHRFIELIKESGAELAGKYATQISTSKHFYDVTAHAFIRDICDDIGLCHIRGLSADMEDLLSKKGRREAVHFWHYVRWSISRGFKEPFITPQGDFKGASLMTATKPDKDTPKTGKKVALVTDIDPERDTKGLRGMIERFRMVSGAETEVIDLREFPFAGGCLGCFHCAADGKCVYKDGFDDYLRTNINDADAVVYAFTIRDHSMGSRFKMYDDRQFCNGHRTVTMGKPVAYLIDGHLSYEENLKMLIEARAQVGGNFLAGIATNEEDADGAVDRVAKTLDYALKFGCSEPRNFYGVGGLKIFRDLIYQMQGLMKEDHRFYKKHGFYDFPQKHRGRIAAMYLVSALMNSKSLQKKIKVDMTEGMLMPYRKVVERASPKGG